MHFTVDPKGMGYPDLSGKGLHADAPFGANFTLAPTVLAVLVDHILKIYSMPQYRCFYRFKE